MTVEIKKVRNFPFDEDYWFMTKQAVHNSTQKYFAVDWYVDIPERFKPQETASGSIMVNVDGTGYMLDEVLGKDKTAKESFVYAPDSIQNAKYSIKGTTLSNSLKFEGIIGKDPVQVAPQFPEVGSFKLINKGNFVARMQVVHSDPNTGKTAIYEPSGYHDICKYAERTIDLSRVSEIKNGEIVTLRAFVVLGKDVEATETYTFKKGSGVMATYEISGTTLKPKIKKV